MDDDIFDDDGDNDDNDFSGPTEKYLEFQQTEIVIMRNVGL